MVEDRLTEKSALAVAREWVDDRIPRSKVHIPRGSQTRHLMEQLAARCAVESIRRKEDRSQLCDRLSDAWDILHSAWYLAAPEYATRWRLSDDEKPDAEEEKKIEQAKHVVWRRHDPKRSFEEGYESEHYFSGDKESLAATISNYLERPWLRHPTLDWILLDMTITQELCAYGESLKQQWLPGQKDELGLFHKRYHPAKGNLAKMTKLNWGEWSDAVIMKAVWFVVIPVGAIWAGFHYGYEGAAVTLMSIYGLLVTAAIATKLIRFLVRVGYGIAGKPHPQAKPFLLWNEMYEVWRRLEGPIVNPTRVREAMSQSTEKGAVWDTASWALIDKVISFDAAAWITHPTTPQ